MTMPINWGIIAPGKIANKFAADLKLSQKGKLHAVASRNLSKANEFAEQHHAAVAYGSYSQLYQDPHVDVVYIASPHALHYEQCIEALENNKHVLCEKPLAMNQAEFKSIMDLAKANNCFLMEAIWTRFTPSFIQCKQWIEQGKIGQITSIQADFGYNACSMNAERISSKSLGGGSLLDIGIYPAFLALELLGVPEIISAQALLSPEGIDESCCFNFLYPDRKAFASLFSTTLSETHVEASICGSKGRIRMNSRWHNPTSLEFRTTDKQESLVFEKRGLGYIYEIEEVHACVEQGKLESDMLPLSTSYNLIGLLDKIRKQVGLAYPSDHMAK